MRKRDFREAGRRLGRRAFLGGAIGGLAGAALAEPPTEPFFRTRGVVLVPEDIQTWPWPEQAKQAGLSTIATHVTPSQVTFAVHLDGQYVQRHGPPPLADYGKPLSAWRPKR